MANREHNMNSTKSSTEGNNKSLPPRDGASSVIHIYSAENQQVLHTEEQVNLDCSEQNNNNSKKKFKPVVCACCPCKAITLSAAMTIIAVTISVAILVLNKKANGDVKFATLEINWERMTWFNETPLVNLSWKEPEQAASFLRLDETKQLIFLQENGRYDIDLQLNVESSRSLICVKNSRHDKQEKCHRMGEQFIASSVTLPVAMTLWNGDYIWVSVRVDRLYRNDALNYLHVLKHPF